MNEHTTAPRLFIAVVEKYRVVSVSPSPMLQAEGFGETDLSVLPRHQDIGTVRFYAQSDDDAMMKARTISTDGEAWAKAISTMYQTWYAPREEHQP